MSAHAHSNSRYHSDKPHRVLATAAVPTSNDLVSGNLDNYLEQAERSVVAGGMVSLM